MFKVGTVELISDANKLVLKILQASLQQHVNWQLPDIQAVFRKGKGTGDQRANIHWIMEKAREFQKNICYFFIDYVKAFDSTCWCVQSWPTLCNPMVCSSPGSSVHGLFQARILERVVISFSIDCTDHNKLWEMLKEMGVTDHFTCLLRNLYMDQEATVRTRQGTIDWLKIGKGVQTRLCIVNLLI